MTWNTKRLNVIKIEFIAAVCDLDDVIPFDQPLPPGPEPFAASLTSPVVALED